jgi:hypothetical protein
MSWKSLCITLILALFIASAELRATKFISTESLLEFNVAKKPDDDLFIKYDQEVEDIKLSLSVSLGLAELKKLISEQIRLLNQKVRADFK